MDRAAVSIVGKVGQVLVDELQDISGVGDKVVHLRDELATMNAALRIISEADQESVDHLVREWEKQVHDLAHDAEDCTDTYLLRIVRPTPRPPNNVTGNHLIFSWAGYLLSWAKRVARYPYEKLVLQRTVAADIKALLACTTIISKRCALYGIDRTALPRAAFLAPVSAASISANALRRADDPDQFVGIMEQANVLVRKIKAPVHDEDDKINAPVHDEGDQIKALVHDQHDKIEAAVEDEDDKRLKVFYIVGFGGLGKTILAMELCRQLEADFPRQDIRGVGDKVVHLRDELATMNAALRVISEAEHDSVDHLVRSGRSRCTTSPTTLRTAPTPTCFLLSAQPHGRQTTSRPSNNADG